MMIDGLGGLMGQLGFSEMLVIFIVALLVFGPKKLPELGKSLGKGIREFKKATEELKSTWDDQIREVEAPLKDVSRDIQQTAHDVTSDFHKEPEATPATHEAPHPTPTESAVPKEH